MEKTIEIFICYAHKDQLRLNELKAHLTPMLRSGLIDMWHDADISPGISWEKEIDKHLNTAGIILLLVSPDFIASEYCYSKEMRRAMEQYEKGEARVIPIILRPTQWQKTPFGMLQALPKGALPVTKWRNRDDAFLDIAEGVRKAAEDFASSMPSFPSDELPFFHDPKNNSDTQQMIGKDSEWIPAKPILRAVVVGINQYSDQRYTQKAKLKFARTDAEEMYNVLRCSNAWKVEDIQLITDEHAKRIVVSQHMRTVFSSHSSNSNSIALFYFSGHGVHHIHRSLVSLCCHDIDFTDPDQGGIRTGDISNWLLHSSAKCSIALIDATFSGSVINTIRSHEIQQDKTIAIFTACGSDESARERVALQHGIFTAVLLRGWRDGEACDDNGIVTLFGLADYMTRTMTIYVQKPQVFIHGENTILLSR